VVSLTVTTVTAGRAHQALADAVRDAKRGNPLHPVTVIVTTNAAGVMARRALGRTGGVAAVEFVTLLRLAERIAGPSLRAEERLPVSTAVVDIVVRGVLASNRTAFDEVADHASTVTALRDLHRQLRIAGPAACDALATASRRGRDVAQVSRTVAQRLAGDWYDEGDLLSHAITAIESSGLGPGLTDVVLFLPQPLGPLERGLIEAIGAAAELSVVLAVSGDATADRDLTALAAMLGDTPAVSSTERVATPPAAATEVVSVTDADEEVRHAVRVVVDAVRSGTPLDAIAILWPSERPYARLVEHHLDVAGITWNGRPGTRVSERVVPRFLLDLLQVDRRGLRRRDLFDLLADVPVRDAAGRPTQVAAWERASRSAGVVKGEQWIPRLRSYASWQRRPASGDDADVPAISSRADAADDLAEFVTGLRNDLGRGDARRTWKEWATWANTQIEQRLGPSLLQQHGEAETQAWEHTTRVLDRLSHLDRVGGPPTRSEFRSVFAAEFDVAPGRLGRIGAGVTIGSLAGAVGLVAQLAIVMGAAEGLMPAPPTVDPLLSDADRAAAHLSTSDAVADRMHRQLLGVLDSAERVVITTPRGDLRTTTTRQPSRWLAALAGFATNISVDSHASGLMSTSFPAHAAEHRLRRRSAHAGASGPLSLQPLAAADRDVTFSRSLTLRAARRLDALSEFDGDLTGVGLPSLDGLVSPTQLQTWAACPHAYFVTYLLGVRAVDDPTDSISLTPLDRGSALHEVLDAFHREVVAGALPQPGPNGWGDEHRRRLIELMAVTGDRYERAGRTGRAAYWSVDRGRLASELSAWLDYDSAYVSARGAQVIASEHRFGANGEVTLTLPNGRRLAVTGSVDRIDRTPTGLIVTDHKSGSLKRFKAIAADDPTSGRTHFQLPAYAAATLVGQPNAVVRAEYAFFSAAKFKRIGYEFDGDVWDRVGADLEHVVSGIDAGWFPATAPVPKYRHHTECAFCEPDELGTLERHGEWERKRHDPRVARWFADLAPADDLDDADGFDEGSP
jgi:ATP-dependent helicase/nuclease subunit B